MRHLSPLPEYTPPRRRRPFRWLLPFAVLALAPKCVLCLLAYVGLGAALGLGGPEWCGAPAGPLSTWLPWIAGPAALGLILLITHAVRAAAKPAPAGSAESPLTRPSHPAARATRR